MAATSLEAYLRGPHNEDGAFLRRLLTTVEEVVPLFYKRTIEPLTPEGTVKGAPGRQEVTWPYAVSRGEPDKPTDGISHSTHGMILFALDSFSPRGPNEHSLLLGKNFRPCKLSGAVVKTDRMKQVIADAKRTLLARLSAAPPDEPLVKSSTYGENDPFTLTWLAEIVFRLRQKELGKLDATPAQLEACKGRIREAVAEVLKREKGVLETRNTEGKFGEVTSSFLVLRRLHLVKTLANLDRGPAGKPADWASEWLDQKTPDLWTEFDATIHRQLSYSAMGDPKFDPAELAFAFEGALLLHPTWVTPQTVGKVFEALALSRDRHPYWRPVKPFIANSRGHVLFLVSVEVANSILRACEIFDEEEARPAAFSQFEPHLREYARWLFGEVEELPDPESDSSNLLGWRTDYEERRNTIQLWHTSHVLTFLSHYASLLKRKIAADGIDAAGLHVRAAKDLKKIKGYWEQEPLPLLAGAERKGEEESQYAVLTRIKRHYIEPRQSGGAAGDTPARPPLYSMLLYGPPGTGKTTVAEQLAATLGWPLVVITVSDFLAAGAADVENRAKAVFKVLNSQNDVVILFDEIDQFLLDRNSALYREQDDVFKFMTPGMLTKLQDLRDAENSVFLLATNYYERIDSAIKRRGRIDEHFLLSVPDQEQRLRTIEHFMLKVFEDKLREEGKYEQYEAEAGKDGRAREFLDYVSAGQSETGEKHKGITKKDFREALENVPARGGETRDAGEGQGGEKPEPRNVLRETALFGWGDLKNLVESRTKIDAGMSLEDFAHALADGTDKVESAVSLSAYRSRFGAGGPDPFEEFFLLLYLVAEVGGKLQDADVAAIRHVLKYVTETQRKTYEYLKDLKHERARRALETYMEKQEESTLKKWKGGETDDEDERRKRSKDLLETLADMAEEREKARGDAGPEGIPGT